MMQLSESHACIRHAIIAFSETHEVYTEVKAASDGKFANLHYGKAIKEAIALSNSTTKNAVEVALAACVLFSGVESLRGHYRSSLEHLSSGLRIIHEERNNNLESRISCTPPNVLLSLFLLLDSQMMDVGGTEYGRGRVMVNEILPPVPASFSSPEDASMSLEAIFNLSMHFLCRVDEVAVHRDLPADLYENINVEKAAFRRTHAAWEAAFNAMIEEMIQKNPQRQVTEEPAVSSLKLTSKSLHIMLGVDFHNSEVDFDRFLPTFAEIVTEAETFLAGTPTVTKTFSMARGCVGPLFFAAIRCRDSVVRHNAQALLAKCQRREGLWDSGMTAVIAREIIAVEEANALTPSTIMSTSNSSGVHDRMEGLMDEDEGRPSYRATQIPEDMRVKCIDPTYGLEEMHASISTEYAVPIKTETGWVDSNPYYPLLT
jgi:hypothetical protein